MNMKKLFAGLVLALFVLSVMPAALGEVNEKDRRNRLYVESLEDNSEDRVKGKAFKLDKAKLMRQANIAKEDRKEHRQRFAQLKIAQKEFNDQLKERRAKLAELKAEQKACDTDDCKKEVKGQIKTVAAERLRNAIDVMQNSLEKLANRVQDSEKISDGDKEHFLNSIDNAMESVAAQKEKISEDMTNEEFRAVVKNLKETRKAINDLKRSIVGELVTHKIAKAHISLENLYESMQKRIEFAKEEGHDTTSIEEIAEEFRAHISRVNEAKDLAYEAVKEARESGDYSEVREAKETAKEVLKEAKEKVREFVRAFTDLTTG